MRCVPVCVKMLQNTRAITMCDVMIDLWAYSREYSDGRAPSDVFTNLVGCQPEVWGLVASARLDVTAKLIGTRDTGAECRGGHSLPRRTRGRLTRPRSAPSRITAAQHEKIPMFIHLSSRPAQSSGQSSICLLYTSPSPRD